MRHEPRPLTPWESVLSRESLNRALNLVEQNAEAPVQTFTAKKQLGGHVNGRFGLPRPGSSARTRLEHPSISGGEDRQRRVLADVAPRRVAHRPPPNLVALQLDDGGRECVGFAVVHTYRRTRYSSMIRATSELVPMIAHNGRPAASRL